MEKEKSQSIRRRINAGQCLEQTVEDKAIEKNPARAFHYTKPKAVKTNSLFALRVIWMLRKSENRLKCSDIPASA